MSNSLLLSLYFKDLNHVEKRDGDYIRQAVLLCIQENLNLIISVECDEIKQNKIDSIWYKIQQLLGVLYVFQLTASYQQQKPLFNCQIIFQDICGYPIHLEPYIQGICVVPEQKDLVEGWNQSRKIPLKSYQLTECQDKELVAMQHCEINQEPHQFQRVAVGGTFDHIHAGHKILLTMTAILCSKSMVVGVTDDAMLVKKKHRDLITPIDKRISIVRDFLLNTKRDLIYDVVPITDPFGPTITDPTIDALVVSKETLKGGNLVNEERKLRDFPILEIRIIDVISPDSSSIQAENMDTLKISSSWIREYLANQNQ